MMNMTKGCFVVTTGIKFRIKESRLVAITLGFVLSLFVALTSGKVLAAGQFQQQAQQMMQTQKLFSNDGLKGDFFGFGVAISGDTAVVGGPYVDVAANQ